MSDPTMNVLQEMFKVFSQLPLEAQELFEHNVYELMVKRNNSSYYSYSTFKSIVGLCSKYNIDHQHRSILEIGAGKPLGMGVFWNLSGAKKYTSIDRYVPVNLDKLWINRFRWILDMNLYHPDDFNIANLIRENGDNYLLNPDKIEMIQEDFADYPFPPNSFDFIYSFAVLEHVADVTTILNKMYQVLRDDGKMIHIIDLREHHTNLRTVPNKDTSIDFLKYSQAEWESMYPPGSEHYINRLRASDFNQKCQKSGFEVIDFITTQEMTIGEEIYDRIHDDFRKYLIDDLKVMGITIVLQKKSIKEALST
jgi:SAM-dependent methyltransferase